MQYYVCCVTLTNMYNLQKYSSTLLVFFIFYIQTLTGLPYEVQPVNVAQPQLDVGLPLAASHVPDDSVDARFLNVSNSDPNSRSLDTAQAFNASVDPANPSVRSLPAPGAPVQQDEVAARIGYGYPNPAAVAGELPVNQDVPPQQRFDTVQANANLTVQADPAARYGLTPNSNPNVSVEQRSLNTNPTQDSQLQNNSQVEQRSLNPAPETVNVSGNPFVPSFLETFAMRQKRGEEDGAVAAQPVSTNTEQESPVNNPPQFVLRTVVEEAIPVNNNEPRALEQQNVDVAPNNANEASRIETVSLDQSYGNVPYVNVNPTDKLNY